MQTIPEKTQILIQKLRDTGHTEAADYISDLTDIEMRKIEFGESSKLLQSFIWANTPQGFKYWDKIDTECFSKREFALENDLSNFLKNSGQIPYSNKEKMLEWAQMCLERVDMQAPVLVALIDKVYEDGIQRGREETGLDDDRSLGGFHEDM